VAYASARERLADQVGIVASYEDMFGHMVHTTDETRSAILSALGYDTSSDRALDEELERRRLEQSRRLIAPVEVLPVDSQRVWQLRIRLPPRLEGTHFDFLLNVRCDDGTEASVEGRLLGGRRGTTTLRIPVSLGLGYHSIHLDVDAAGGELSSSQRRIVHPRSCLTVGEVLSERRVTGIWTNLYTLRSHRNCGVGDLTDLARLVDWAHDYEAEFVGINPLHSLRNRDGDVSPYRPTSRLFCNEIYVDVNAVPELSHCAEAQSTLASDEYSEACDRLRRGRFVEYESIAGLKLRLLDSLYESLLDHRDADAASRYRDFCDFKSASGRDLVRYATFRALEHSFLRSGLDTDWQSWPQAFHSPEATSVAEFRRVNHRQVDFHCYVQFELDRQLAVVSDLAHSAMAIGTYGDLALGSDPTGADAWAYQDLIIRGAHIGAPPDDFAAEGQDWGLPPLSPDRLRETGYDYWIKLLQSNMRHLGALRLDHAMGLLRQFWIPRGCPGSQGAYMSYPAGDLLGILALESRRSGTIIVGEDLGTVPAGFQSLLARWGILSSRVLYFERSRAGVFRPSTAYSKRAMVTANTHDQAPLAGYWRSRDLELRVGAGAYADRRQSEQARADRAREREGLEKRLVADGLLPGGRDDHSARELTRAVYSFLGMTPSPLVGVSLDDLACPWSDQRALQVLVPQDACQYRRAGG